MNRITYFNDYYKVFRKIDLQVYTNKIIRVTLQDKSDWYSCKYLMLFITVLFKESSDNFSNINSNNNAQ